MRQAWVAMERASQVLTEHESPMSASNIVIRIEPVHPAIMYARRRVPNGRQRSVTTA